MDVLNQSQLQKIMEQKIRQLLEKSSEEIMDEFKTYVQRFVYDNHGKNSVYRNDDNKFIDSWDWTDIKKKALELSTEMFLNWEKMDSHTSRFGKYGIHGSTVGGMWKPDARPYMDAILDKAISSDAAISVYRRQQYWKMFTKDMFQGGKLKKILDRNAKALGLTVG